MERGKKVHTCSWMKDKSSTPLSTISKLPQEIFKVFSNYVRSAYNTIDEMLRREADRIITLPKGFITKGEEKIESNTSSLSVKIVAEDDSPIYYHRHGNAGVKSIYSEGLSGSQSYLNRLVQIQKDPNSGIGLLTKLAENALMQMLIIDERMCNFFDNREGLIKEFSMMNIWTLDINENHNRDIDNKDNSTLFGADHFTKTRLKINWTIVKDVIEKLALCYTSQQNELINCEYLDSIKNKFDILIFHQGLIDKWLPSGMKSPKGVRFLLDYLKQYFRYVIITTGRGKPANIPSDARVIPFSCIESTLFQKYPEKLLLVDTIMNLLPYGEKIL